MMTSRYLGLALSLTILPASIPAVAAGKGGPPLEGTAAVEIPANIYDVQYQQLLSLFERQIAASDAVRAKRWTRDTSSVEQYAASVAPNRAKVAELIGVTRGDGGVDAKVQPLAEGPAYAAKQVEFGVYDDVRADAVLLLPNGEGPFPVVVACHADAESPEAICGEAQADSNRFARRLAERGFAVLAPRFLPRATDHADAERFAKDVRHVIHRMSYVLGKHPIGVDVDTVRAAIDALPSLGAKLDATRVGVIGAGQGGLTAMYAAALDDRIKAAVIVDYVDDRSRVYAEPADRAIFRHLVEFDDSDVCTLIAPRPLAVVARRDGGAAVGKGVQSEFQAIRDVYRSLIGDNVESLIRLDTYDAGDNTHRDAIDNGIGVLAHALRAKAGPPAPVSTIALRKPADVKARRDRLYDQLKQHFHVTIEASAAGRAKRWANDIKSADQWPKARDAMSAAYLDIVGRCAGLARKPLNPRSQKAFDNNKYYGYKVLLDVLDGVEAYGVLLIPKGMTPGERRPVVICQHGFGGDPERTIGPGDVDQYYRRFPHNLARRGYVVFVPYIIVRTEDTEWQLDRRSKVLGESRVSVCIKKYAAIVDFLQQLPFVDGSRIGFQGLSFGGYTGLWVVSQEPRISPVIVAGYFSDWKARLFDDPKGYMPIRSEEMYTWNILNTFNHSDLAAMICPRPVFIEHGIDHGPSWMTWSGSEYKHVEALYSRLGIPDRQQFYPFPGGHETGTEVAFEFLDKWLGFAPKRMPTGVVFEKK